MLWFTQNVSSLFEKPCLAIVSYFLRSYWIQFVIYMPLLLNLFHSERVKPPMGVNTVWCIRFRQNQVPPHASRLGNLIQQGEQVSKSQLNMTGTGIFIDNNIRIFSHCHIYLFFKNIFKDKEYITFTSHTHLMWDFPMYSVITINK